MIRLAIVIAVSWLSLSAARAEEREPYQWVRTLESVLEEIARGSDAAQIYLPTLISTIADEMEKADNKTLLEKRNLRSILIYTLSGGNSKVIRKVLGSGPLPSPEENIAKGALAFSEGKYSTAAKYLLEIDAKSLDAQLASRVALTQAILVYKSNPKKAIAYLDIARLLSVGTLVEEAAIRREIVFLATDQQFEKFCSLAQRYFRKFGESLYAGYFIKQFAIAASTFDFVPESELDEVADVVDILPDTPRKLLVYLAVAETAIGIANIKLAKYAAQKALLLSEPDSKNRAKAELYIAAADVATVNVSDALKMLETIRGDSLNGSDVGLRQIAFSLGREVESEPHDTGEEVPIKLEDKERTHAQQIAAGTDIKVDISDNDETERLARKVISQADRILHKEHK